jgi:hypothetical protein
MDAHGNNRFAANPQVKITSLHRDRFRQHLDGIVSHDSRQRNEIAFYLGQPTVAERNALFAKKLLADKKFSARTNLKPSDSYHNAADAGLESGGRAIDEAEM